MRNFKRVTVPALVFAGALLVAGAAAEAGCVSKAAGVPAARAIRRCSRPGRRCCRPRSWGSWAQFMASGMKVGSAPGYKVSNMRTSCKAGGMLGTECVITANLCN